MKNHLFWGKKHKAKYAVTIVILIMMIWIISSNWTINQSKVSKALSIKQPSVVKSIQYEDHSPIFIQGNNDFASQAATNGWPGEGTDTAPYIIDGYNITGPLYRELIEIWDTDVHFRISNCLLDHGSSGIDLNHVTNGQIINNTVVNNDYNHRTGISLYRSANCILLNNSVSNHEWHGISLYSSNNCTLINNWISNNNGYGIFLSWTEKVFLINNTVKNNGGNGIYLRGSEKCELSKNKISNNFRGIYLDRSANNVIKDNNLENDSLLITGTNLEDYVQKEVINNLVNNKPLVYWKHVTENTIPCGTGGIILVNCSLVSVMNQNFDCLFGIYCSQLSILRNMIFQSSYGYGIQLEYSPRSVISHNTIDSKGIYLSHSGNSTLINNTVTNNGERGIHLSYSGNGTLTNNKVTKNIKEGITLQGSNDCVLSNNIFSQNGRDGIVLDASDECIMINNTVSSNNHTGILLSASKNSILKNNTVTNNIEEGIFLDTSQENTLADNKVKENRNGGIFLYLSGYNTLTNNIVANNGNDGIYLYFCKNNIIQHNNFINNGLSIRGYQFEEFSQAIIINNSVNGKPLVCWESITGEIVPSRAGQVILVNCTSVEVTGQNLIGVQVAYCSNLDIYNNFISHGRIGIYIGSSYNCTLTYNRVTNNSQGISIQNSANNTLMNNIVDNNKREGISLLVSEYNTLNNNTITNNGGYGISLSSYSHYNTIRVNQFSGNIGGDSQAYDKCLNNSFKLNFWDGWNRPDEDEDGIVDNPYSIDGPVNNLDTYPLVVQNTHVLTPVIIDPNGGENLSGVVTIHWTPSTDSWGHSITYTIYYSADGGVTWIILESGLTTTSYEWNTIQKIDGTNYLLNVHANCSKGLWRVDTSDGTFTIENHVFTTNTTIQITVVTVETTAFLDIIPFPSFFFVLLVLGIPVVIRKRP